jgi:fatty-acyl-CoA synthase
LFGQHLRCETDRMPLTESYTAASADEPLVETTVGELLRQSAVRWPDRVGLIEADIAGALGRRWTFAELDGEAERLALMLAGRYAPGERICVWAPNLPEWVILEFAAARAGLTLVTANPAYRRAS